MKKLSKRTSRLVSRVYGYDYWNYLGAGVAPCNTMPWWHKWECVKGTTQSSCAAGTILCTVTDDPPA